MAVLIVTMPNDADAQLVKFALNGMGKECDIFYSNDLAGGAEWSFNPGVDGLDSSFRGRKKEWRFDKYDAVWMRRPGGVTPREHIQDLRERVAAESESGSLLNAVLKVIERNRFVASPLSATRTAQEKALQLRIACEVGLPMPPTLISNVRDDILRFYGDCDGKMIYKTLVPVMWKTEGIGYLNVRTTAIGNPSILHESDLHSAPGIYQKMIDKRAELRVTILGRTVLAVEKRFDHRPSSELKVDWRAMHRGATYCRHTLPDDIADKCIRLLREMKLVMGAFDLMLDGSGNYYFLEVNPQGQFLWQDQVVPGMNHLEAFAEFLLSRDPDFIYQQSDRISYSMFNDSERHRAMSEREQLDHFGPLNAFNYSTVSVRMVEPAMLSDEAILRNIEEQAMRPALDASCFDAVPQT